MSSPPAWSMGTSRKSPDPKSGASSSPGPGTYNSSSVDKIRPPSWGIGKSARKIKYESIGPGPTAYKMPDIFAKDAPKFHIGPKIVEKARESSPGPGSYDSNSFFCTDMKAPAFTIRGRIGSWINNKEKLPGPGAYDQESKILNTSAPSIRIGTSRRDESFIKEKTPGPGNYTYKEIFTQVPKYSFGTSSRSNVLDETAKTIPGPGAYNIRTKVEVPGGGATMTSRRTLKSLLEAAKLPGPGQYDPVLVHKTTLPSFIIGKSPRYEEDKETKIKPGPGTYDPKIIKGITPAFRIGSSMRRPLSENSLSPGPGKYEIPSKIVEGPRYHIGVKTQDKSLNYSFSKPGPGEYSPEVNTTLPRFPSCKIGSSKRSNFEAFSQAPGPGLYDIQKKEKGPEWRFGSSRRKSAMITMKETPGPGAYNIPAKFADVPRYAIKSASLKINF